MAGSREGRSENGNRGIRGCDYVSVRVEQMDEAIQFYRDALGLPLVYVLPNRWAEFRLGAISLAMYPREPEEGRGGDIGLSVDDIEEEKTRLESKRVAFPHGIESFDLPTGNGRVARFRDPSGNRLELIERAHPSAKRPGRD
jgi:catechol 2,3-dioxygenase-like lactoylglutathione lyase family enzyme